MIDIETTDITPDAGVWQIGWVEISGKGEGKLYNLNPYEQDRSISKDTVKWLESNAPDWNDMQPKFPYLEETAVVLQAFANDIARERFHEVWCKGADFDFTILRSIFRQYDIKMPWHFRNQCCMRTFVNVFPNFRLDPKYKDTAHNALSDAEAQAECVERVLKHISRF